MSHESKSTKLVKIGMVAALAFLVVIVATISTTMTMKQAYAEKMVPAGGSNHIQTDDSSCHIHGRPVRC